MRKPLFGADIELRNIFDNPGNSIEELQMQVKTIASTLCAVVNFINDDLPGHVAKELVDAHRRRS